MSEETMMHSLTHYCTTLLILNGRQELVPPQWTHHARGALAALNCIGVHDRHDLAALHGNGCAILARAAAVLGIHHLMHHQPDPIIVDGKL